jgi:hypothetical protein
LADSEMGELMEREREREREREILCKTAWKIRTST